MVRSRLLAFLGLLGLLQWFFGNLYEQVVFAPNWVLPGSAESVTQVERLQAFFVRTSPTLYFVPFTIVAPALVWLAHGLNPLPAASRAFRLASGCGVLAAALNAFMVVTLAVPLFSRPTHEHAVLELYALCTRWAVFNPVRMLLTGATAWWTLAALRTLDRAAPVHTASAA
jgi:hypothetical protein